MSNGRLLHKIYPLVRLVLVLNVLALVAFDKPRSNSTLEEGVGAQVNGEAIDRFITEQVSAQRIPGLAVAITRGSEVIFTKGYGTSGEGGPITSSSQFFLASVTKSFTALAIMQLAESGKIDLDAPVQRYLPEFTLADPSVAAQITIRHLLNQVSGLSGLGFPDMRLPQPSSIQERVTSLRTAVPVATPGSQYHYFDPNYGVLARVVEVVSGQSFSEYLQSHVFGPLEMPHTMSVVTSSEGLQRADHLAKGYVQAFGLAIPASELSGYLGGSGGVISTAEDMAHYLIMQSNGGDYKGKRLLSPQGIAAMHTPPLGIDTSYAMGWIEQNENGTRIVEHDGIISTYFADAVLLPDQGYGIILLYPVSALSSTVIAFPNIKNGLIALLLGKPLPSGWLTIRLWGVIMALITLAGTALAVRSLVRLPRWASRAGTTSLWRLLPGIVWAFVPGALVAEMPALIAQTSDRVFNYPAIFRSMPDMMIWLILVGVLGIINGMCRIVALVRRAFGRALSRPDLHNTPGERPGTRIGT